MVSLINAYCNKSDMSIALRIINVLLKKGIPCDYLCKYYQLVDKEKVLCPGLKFGTDRCAGAVLISCKEDPKILQRLEDKNLSIKLCTDHNGYR